MSYEMSPDLLDRDAVLEFFWKFSVFECALKREGFLKEDRWGGAEPDWSEFERQLLGRFSTITSPSFADAVALFRSAPPKRQVVKAGRLGWQQVSRGLSETSEEAFILKLVRTVRNNLFHGGKYPDGPIEEIARNRKLLSASMTILDECCNLCPRLRQWVSYAA